MQATHYEETLVRLCRRLSIREIYNFNFPLSASKYQYKTLRQSINNRLLYTNKTKTLEEISNEK